MSEWKECKLGDVITLNYGKSLPVKKRNNGDIPVYSSAGLTGWHDKALVDSKGLIIGRKGTIGNVYKSETPFYAIDTSYYVLPNNDVYDFDFLFYLLDSIGLDELNEDSAVPGLNRDTAYSQEIYLPSLPEQRAIASVLSSLDDKIDLLHRQNKTLEAMAETLFRQWFVEGADEGWKEGNLLELIQLVGGGTPKTSNQDYWGGDIPWLAGGDIATNHKSFVNYAEKRITEVGLNNSSAKLLPKYATVISARGTVGKYCLLAETMAFSQSNYGILPNIKNCFFFTYLLINHVVEELQSSAYGSVFDTITTTTFKENKVPIPTETEIVQFEKSISSYFQKMFMNKYQIHTLEKLRGTLLPKLMCGEVRLKI
ncbi:MAG: restriction endonuclease subunit S [Methanosarcinaceae archaeon]|nr:restriction endonuclease subunit S [Methanosarcinaceae archaeon]